MRLIQMPGGEASTSLQKAFVRDQSIFVYEVAAASKRFRKMGKVFARLIFCWQLSKLRKRSQDDRRKWCAIFWSGESVVSI